jgi:type IV secretion system protein VirB4
LFDLDLGPATLAFAGASTPQDQRDIDAVLAAASPTSSFAADWLRHRSLDWAAELLSEAPVPAPQAALDPDPSQEHSS